MPPQTRLRQPVACVPCRKKKVKCDGQHPCAYCKKHDWECAFPLHPRKRRQCTSDQDVNKRLARGEAFIGTQSTSSVLQPENGPAVPTDQQGLVLSLYSDPQQGLHRTDETAFLSSHAISPSVVLASPAPLQSGATASNGINNSMHSEGQTAQLTPAITAESATWRHHYQTSANFDSLMGDSPSDQESGLIEQNATQEYHGASSMLSVFSKLGSQWVSKQTGALEFESMASALASQIVTWLKLTQRIPEERAAEPDRDTALELSSAYFEDDELSFGILHQPSFERRLRQFFDGRDSNSADPGWYALRHTVYASGKRKILKDAGVVNFNEVHSSAFPYFANALAVHTEMIYYKSSITAVQALAAMAHYAEAIGAPSLEYMLQSNAIRLAQSKALHRKAPRTLGLSHFEVQQRNLLFWFMYVQEKHIAYWSGRPSVMDDDSITCPLPEETGSDSGNQIVYFNLLIRLTQILSAVLKFVSRLETRGMDPDKLFRRVHHLNAQLRTWSESAPPACRPEPFQKSSLPPDVSGDLVLYIRYTYYGVVIALNSCFTYPWLMERVSRDGDSRFQKQIDESTVLVAEMSRRIIKDTKHIDIDFTSPVWLVFAYPLMGLIHLFVHIMKFPTVSTVQYDLALLEDICGHFARLKYTTSLALSFPLLKELCRFAEQAVENLSKTSTDVSDQALNNPGTMRSDIPERDGGVPLNDFIDFSEELHFNLLGADPGFEPLYPIYVIDA